MIRVVLLVALVAIGAVVTFGRNTAGLRASRKLLFLTVLFSGCVSVVFPELVSDIATFLGVGRGTDLLLYVMTVMVLTITVTGYVDKKRAERQFNWQAIREGKDGAQVLSRDDVSGVCIGVLSRGSAIKARVRDDSGGRAQCPRHAGPP